MLRLIVLALLFVIAVWLVRRALAGPRKPQNPRPDGEPGALVRCAHCGVHLPAAEARVEDGAAYCSAEHARLGPGESP